MAVDPPRKPIRAERLGIPELMAKLGVTCWTNVPNPILERWMAPDNPARLRVMAALIRHSFGYLSPYAVHLVKGKQQPLYQAELARLLDLENRWVRRVLAETKTEGLVKTDGKLLYPVPTPPEMRVKLTLPAFSSPFASSSPSGEEEPTDPQYLSEVVEIKRNYLREIGEAKGRMVQRLALARARAEERAKRVNLTLETGVDLTLETRVDLTPETGVDLTLVPAPLKRKESEKKGQAGGLYVQPETVPEIPPAGPPACPSVEVEQLQRYLEQFTHLVGEAPPLAEVEEIHQRLLPATLGQFQTHVENRLARGFRPHGWRVFCQLATDCAKGKEAFEAPTASAPKDREAKLSRLQRALEKR